jgi:hypothetical protein
MALLEKEVRTKFLFQVTEYLKKAGIAPKLPDVPFDLSEDFDKRFNMN